MIFEGEIFGVKLFILDCCLKNIDDVVANEHLENIEKVKINPSLIQPSKEIKSLGNFDVLINLHSEVQTQIVIKTVPQEESQ